MLMMFCCHKVLHITLLIVCSSRYRLCAPWVVVFWLSACGRTVGKKNRGCKGHQIEDFRTGLHKTSEPALLFLGSPYYLYFIQNPKPMYRSRYRRNSLSYVRLCCGTEFLPVIYVNPHRRYITNFFCHPNASHVTNGFLIEVAVGISCAIIPSN